jgi:hypothetical protein
MLHQVQNVTPRWTEAAMHRAHTPRSEALKDMPKAFATLVRGHLAASDRASVTTHSTPRTY